MIQNQSPRAILIQTFVCPDSIIARYCFDYCAGTFAILSARSGVMQCSKRDRYSITSSAGASGLGAAGRFTCYTREICSDKASQLLL
jgi:hypothetical protein